MILKDMNVVWCLICTGSWIIFTDIVLLLMSFQCVLKSVCVCMIIVCMDLRVSGRILSNWLCTYG